MDIPPIKGFCCFLCLTTVFFSHVRSASGETAEQASAASAQDAAKRLQWLKSMQTPAVAAAAPLPSPTPAPVRKRFAETRNLGVRFNDPPTMETSPTDKGSTSAAGKGSDGNGKATAGVASKESRVAEGRGAEPPAKASSSPSPKVADSHSNTSSTTASKSAGKPEAGARHEENVASGKRIAGPHMADTPSPKSNSGTTHTENVAGKRAADSRVADTHPAATPASKTTPSPSHSESVAGAKRSTDSRIADSHSTPSPSPKSTPAPTRADNVASTKRSTDSRIADTHPTPTPSPKASPAPAGTGSVASTKRATDLRIANTHPATTPSPKSSPAPARADNVASAKPAADRRLADIRPTETPSPRLTSYGTRGGTVSSRYPWKTAIVTTVFWIGEPVGGNNFTPNCSSSWDAHWTQSYGGFDNPKPEARRNFLPVNFTPRQNPFYVALPYNDVTRGTTKPEARVVIPWFKEAFRKEGQSVCRDRWVQIRSRGGRVVYAQWSDCGPFRTDHWQYVFGMERPKPNLNAGAGLDVSPAVRDYLGLQSTDVTDWKFVDAREVPNGPWLLYGDNNPFAQRRAGGTKVNGAVLAEVAANRR